MFSDIGRRFLHGSSLSSDRFNVTSGSARVGRSSIDCLRPLVRLFRPYELVVDPQENRRKDAYGHDHPPHHFRLVFFLAEVVNEKPAELPPYERPDSQRQESESHVRPLLARWREPGNVFIVARRLGDFAQRYHNQGKDCSGYSWPHDQNDPSQRNDQRADDDGTESMKPLSEDIDCQRQGNHHQRTGHQHELGVSMGINVVVNVKRESDELLPIDDPVAGEDQQEQHEAWIGNNGPEISGGLRETSGFNFIGAARFPEEQQDAKEHQEDAQGSHAKDIFHLHTLVYVRSDIRPGRTSDVYQGVVNGVADGADVFFRSTGGGANDAGLYQRYPQRWKGQHKGHENNQGDVVAHRRQPRCSQRPQQEVGAAQDQIGKRKRAAEAHAVGEGSAKYRQKPHQPAKEASERTCLFDGEMQGFMEIARQRSEGRVIGKPFEQLADVSDPEGTLKAGANVTPTLRKAQNVLLMEPVVSCQ